MQHSKIQLSEDELMLVNNTEWILTKQKIIAKVYHLMGLLSERMQLFINEQHGLPAGIVHSTPKISKGEQYESLPYVVLDYPRDFSKENVFGIRSFFWWGNYFTSTLHLKGKYWKQAKQGILDKINSGQFNNYYLSCSGKEFDFNIHNGAYQLISGTENHVSAAAIKDAPFVKITALICFDDWNESGDKLWEAFQNFMSASVA